MAVQVVVVVFCVAYCERGRRSGLEPELRAGRVAPQELLNHRYALMVCEGVSGVGEVSEEAITDEAAGRSRTIVAKGASRRGSACDTA